MRDVLKTVRGEGDDAGRSGGRVDRSGAADRDTVRFFGALGALLAAIGLYGLLAYTVARRTKEIGIRMALGATERDVMRMVLKGALGLVCAGLVVGLPIAFWSQPSRRGRSQARTSGTTWRNAGQHCVADRLRGSDDDCGRAAGGLLARAAGGSAWIRCRRCGTNSGIIEASSWRPNSTRPMARRWSSS